MPFVRTLHFRRGEVEDKPVTLLLCFQVPNPNRLYKDQFSVAWRVVPFEGKNYLYEDFDATYQNELIFSHPQIEGPNNVVSPKQSVHVEPGQRTVLQKNDSDHIVWSKPEGPTGKYINAKNDTGADQDIAIGFIDENKLPKPLVVFKQVVNGLSVSVEFKPVLQAYVITTYTESGELEGDIQFVDPIWTQDLLPLNDHTNLLFEKDVVTKKFIIKEDNDRRRY